MCNSASAEVNLHHPITIREIVPVSPLRILQKAGVSACLWTGHDECLLLHWELLTVVQSRTRKWAKGLVVWTSRSPFLGSFCFISAMPCSRGGQARKTHSIFTFVLKTLSDGKICCTSKKQWFVTFTRVYHSWLHLLNLVFQLRCLIRHHFC